MKTLLVIFAVAALCGSKALADNTPALPALGAGDPNLLVWMNPDLIQFYILTYIGEKSLPEYHLYTENLEKNSLKLLYPHDAGAIVGLELQHCYPFGNGQGFLRTIKFSTKTIPAKYGSGQLTEATLAPSDIILFEEQKGRLVTKALNDEIVRQEFDLKPGCRFLGKLDSIVFFWDQGDEDVIVGRDTKTNTVYRWKVPGIYIVEGVLRGTKKDYAFVVYRHIHKFANATGEKTVIEVSVKDAYEPR
ncbi:MAG: hypothetical protein ABI273_15720 [Lacunisphaera sp.]